jgi:hypothetical protein
MGRVVQSDRLVIGSSPRQRLVVLAAARAAGVGEEEMQRRVQVRWGRGRKSCGHGWGGEEGATTVGGG